MSETVYAKRRALTNRELAASGGVYTGKDLAWFIPNEQITAVPKPADLLTDSDGVVHTILEVDELVTRNLYKCVTRAMAIVNDLRDIIDIQRPGISYDSAGAVVKSWPTDSISPGGSTPYSGLACRVQRITSTQRDERGIRAFAANYQVTVGQQVVIGDYDRVKVLVAADGDAAGAYLEIRGVHNPERIDELPVLDCERVP